MKKYQYFKDVHGGFIATEDGQTQICDFREGMGDTHGVEIADALTHGGKRPNAGRKATGAKTVTRSVSMPAEVWAEIDSARGGHSRGRWISGLWIFWRDRSKKKQGEFPRPAPP